MLFRSSAGHQYPQGLYNNSLRLLPSQWHLHVHLFNTFTIEVIKKGNYSLSLESNSVKANSSIMEIFDIDK